jgi:hypothetical protein
MVTSIAHVRLEGMRSGVSVSVSFTIDNFLLFLVAIVRSYYVCILHGLPTWVIRYYYNEIRPSPLLDPNKPRIL